MDQEAREALLVELLQREVEILKSIVNQLSYAGQAMKDDFHYYDLKEDYKDREPYIENRKLEWRNVYYIARELVK